MTSIRKLDTALWDIPETLLLKDALNSVKNEARELVASAMARNDKGRAKKYAAILGGASSDLRTIEALEAEEQATNAPADNVR